MTDRIYEARRNKLIASAEKTANESMPPKPKTEAARQLWCDEWNRIYFATMNELAKNAGL